MAKTSVIRYQSLEALLQKAEREATKMAKTAEAVAIELDYLRSKCPGGRITLNLNESISHNADIEDYGVIVQTGDGIEVMRKDWDSGKATYIGEDWYSGVGFVDIPVSVSLPFRVTVVMKRWESPRTYTVSRVGDMPLHSESNNSGRAILSLLLLLYIGYNLASALF